MDKMTRSPIQTTGAAGFLQWLQRYQPQLYAQIKGQLPKNMAGFGEVATTSAASTQGASPSWLQTVQNIIGAAGQAWLTKQQVDAQKDILRMQLDRAASGLAPLDIDPSKYGLPGANVSLGLTPDIKKMLMYGGIGIVALIFLPKILHAGRSR